MKVELYRFDSDGKNIKVGEITLTDGALTADTPLAVRVLTEPVYDFTSKKQITSKQGEPFLLSLHRNYRGHALWATQPK